jgi:hypothetical protein
MYIGAVMIANLFNGMNTHIWTIWVFLAVFFGIAAIWVFFVRFLRLYQHYALTLRTGRLRFYRPFNICHAPLWQ